MRYQDLPTTRCVFVPDEYDGQPTNLPMGVYVYDGESGWAHGYRFVDRDGHVVTVGYLHMDLVQPWPPAPENRPPLDIYDVADVRALHCAADRDGKLTWTWPGLSKAADVETQTDPLAHLPYDEWVKQHSWGR